jgi:hypothetical protein
MALYAAASFRGFSGFFIYRTVLGSTLPSQVSTTRYHPSKLSCYTPKSQLEAVCTRPYIN